MADSQFTTEELATEEWRPVTGYESIYSVSSLGRVRREKTATNTHAGRLLKQRLNRYGYPKTCLSAHSEQVEFTVHTLVAAAFIGPRPHGLQINHIDGDKANNRPANLEYVTPLENSSHAAKIGLYPLGERNGRAKLNEWQVRVIKRLPPSMSQRKIARLFGVERKAVGRIRKGENWCHIATPDVLPDTRT